jgi:hypothetical protein
MIRKYLVIFCFLLVGVVDCQAEQAKDYFSGKTDQFAFYFGDSMRGNIEPLCIVNGYYSQKNKFFRLQGRRNFEVLGFLGWGTFKRSNCFLLGLSQDIIVPVYKTSFFGVGLGPYISNKETPRVSSKFAFGVKLFIGMQYKNECIELVWKHFSNGHLTDKNIGHNFYGVTIAHNFSFN